MAITNHERVGRALDLLRNGLAPFVERELKAKFGERWASELRSSFADRRLVPAKGDPLKDVAVVLAVMDKFWGQVFGASLGRTERNAVLDLTDARNRWAHQEQFSGDQVYRVLDSAVLLLQAVSAPQAAELDKARNEVLRLRYDEQVRGEKRKAGGSLIEGAASESLRPWREVVTPHADVASGRYQQAEFAADLWQVHLGEGANEYRDPKEFFRRTYLTESLRRLLLDGLQRLSGTGGDPVVQLQTNFGGGKTHSMLALYHLFSGANPADLAGIEELLVEAKVRALPKANRVVLVGNKISPGNPVTKPDGTVVRTLWGELTWQLGHAAGGPREAKKAFSRIKADDEAATSPGDVLRELFIEYGPCLILVDEWVAYARQLHDESDLPAGSFETQFSFAQVLTESAKLARNTMLVVSLPASDTAGSPHAQADDIEVGGIRGRTALDRLRNVIGRVESSWRPATAEEGFEIVRRRLFEPLAGPEAYKLRDVTARAFSDLYRTHRGEFPTECARAEYEERIKAAFPIHPEIFDRLYADWSTLVKFQRTRGVLRLMAAVIHSLWEKGDRSPLILPCTIPIDDQRVQFELTRYLSDNWVPIIARDVDGPAALPLRIDSENTNLGKVSATRRVARTIYLGSAPSSGAAHRGLEDRQIKLGCVMPGEAPATFGDALRRLAAAATYLYQDGSRFWYATQPTVTKLADDRAEELRRNPDKVHGELENRLKADLRQMGDFSRVHIMPKSSADVADDREARLVVLEPSQPYQKQGDGLAESAARQILESRGNAPRLYRNTLAFLAADSARYQDLDEAIRRYLAWASILSDKEMLDLSPHQVRQAETQLKAADSAVTARLPEAYQWVLVPEQRDPAAPVSWQALKLGSGEGLAVRASKKLRNDELLVTSLGATVLRKHLDEVPLWQGDHVQIRELADHFARYLYLPRLADSHVLAKAIRDGVGLLTWRNDAFAYAESYDELKRRYAGLRAGQNVEVSEDGPGLLVKPAIASAQLEQEPSTPTPPAPDPGTPVNGKGKEPGGPPSPAPVLPRRYHGSVALDPDRVGRDAARIAEEVVAHLVGQVGAEVRVTLEIEAQLPEGATEQLQRTVVENSRTLRFSHFGFERD